MKKTLAVMAVLLLVIWALPIMAQEKPMAQEPAPAPAKEPAMAEEPAMAPGPAFDVSRLVMTSGIEDREPVDSKESFDVAAGTVYCFLEATDIAEDTGVSIVWYYFDEETARVGLTLRKGSRWRTYSSKKLGGRKGDWKVEVQDASGTAVKDISFTVK